MIIKFIVENFKSIKNKVILNLTKTSISGLEETNIIQHKGLELLKTTAIYGANASGKSNLVDALAFMRWFVINSSKNTQVNEAIDYNPFRLNTKTENAPSFFEVEFFIGSTRFRYGFSHTKKQIIKEWLFRKPKIKEYPLFVREGQEIFVDKERFKEGDGIESKTRSNALFLSVVAQFNGEIASKLIEWFNKINPLHGLQTDRYVSRSIEYLEDERKKNTLLQTFKKLDLDIQDLNFVESEFLKEKLNDVQNVLDSKNEFLGNVTTTHKKYNEKGQEVGTTLFVMDEDESAGTEKIFNILGVILDAVFDGEIIIIDELDARLHPILVRSLVKLFHSEMNTKGQVIFVSHDATLLDQDLLRRDQIYFIEKDRFGASQLYSLVEYKPRKDTELEKNYLKGKFGAIPFIGNLNFEKNVEEEENIQRDIS